MDEFEDRFDGYRDPVDIRKFCRGLEEAWKLTPDFQFTEIIEAVFDGYNPDQLTGEEMCDMINEYILQNE